MTALAENAGPAGLDGLARDGLAGDRQAFDRLVDTATPPAFRFLHRGGGHADVEDAVGAAWVDVIAGRAFYDGSRPFQPWFNGVARKKLLSIIRSNRHRSGSGGVGLEDMPAPSDQNRNAENERPFWEERVQECWEGLSSEDHDRIHLRFPRAPEEFLLSLEQINVEHIRQLLLDNPTCDQIAAKLQQDEPGLTEHAVRGRIWRALERFRRCLDI